MIYLNSESTSNTYIGWLCCSLFQQSDCSVLKSNQQLSFLEQAAYPRPHLERVQTSSLTSPPPPLATLVFSLWDKFHRKRPRFRRLVVADRPHTATACCDPNVSYNKEIAINTYLIYTELFYGRNNVFELRIHLLNTNT
jgi:hypothetical protein